MDLGHFSRVRDKLQEQKIQCELMHLVLGNGDGYWRRIGSEGYSDLILRSLPWWAPRGLQYPVIMIIV